MGVELSKGSFHAIILPTEQCNFRCTYCYESFEIGKMKTETAVSIQSFLKRKIESIDALYISWFGGEPLLAFDVIKAVSEQVIEKANKSNTHYAADITTNASLLNLSTFDNLLGLKISKFQITLDGDEIDHNKTRVKKNGSGSFREIWDNLIAIKKSKQEFQILLRVHYHNNNITQMHGFKSTLLQEFGDDCRFKIFFRPLSKLGGKNDDELPICSESDILEHNRDLNSIPEKSAYKILENNPVCYASRPDSIVFRADGTLSKCTARLDSKANSIGAIDNDGKIQIVSEDLIPWISGFIQNDFERRRCPARFV